MDSIVLLLSLGVVFELVLHIPGLWRGRSIWAGLAIAATAAGSILLVTLELNLWTAVVLLASAYRLFNMARILHPRMHDRYLNQATLRTTLVLTVLQALLLLGWLLWEEYHTTGHGVWAVVAGLQAIGAVVLLASTLRRLQKTAWPKSTTHYSDNELPTVTVAIPARNETEDLQACLKTVIASDYPKLEILVLDDCSQDKRTPEIIRSFAHDGVRFIKGEEPSETWLPKNQAYDHLAREASGEYMLYCGVDVRFERDSIRKIVSGLLAKKKQMMAILPLREPQARGRFSVVQAMRYWWELVPPRRLFKRPPVLSSCWIIKRSAIKEAGGFVAVARSIVPEAFFARKLQGVNDGYSFMRSGAEPGVSSVKQPADQRRNALRTRYPQVHRRPESAFLTSVAEAFFLIMPFLMLPIGFWLSIGTAAHVLFAIACGLLIISYVLVALSTRINNWWFAIIALPVVVSTDIILLHYSMWRYEFSVIEWKDRNICIPAMHVVPHLPKLR